MNNINVNGEDLPFKFTKRALSNFEKAAKIRIADFEKSMQIEHLAMMCLEALRVGHLLEKKPFRMTIDEVFSLDDQYGIIDQIMDKFGDDEKKPEAS